MKTHPEYQYLILLRDILEQGKRVPNRTGVDTQRILGTQSKYDLTKGFPLFTTKKVWWKGVVHELLWFLSGSTNIKYLVDNNVHIWTDDAYRVYEERHSEGSNIMKKDAFVNSVRVGLMDDDYTYGDLGPVYGSQWRKWKAKESHWAYKPHPDGNTSIGIPEYVKGTIDQVTNLVEGLKNNPSSRRHILSAWNVAEVDQMGLPPCHVMSQYTVDDGLLHCHMYQRSCDMFLGVPFNVASYSLLTHMLAQVCGLKAGTFIHTMHDCHIYVNHLDQVREQLTRIPRELPTLELNPDVSNIDDFKYEDIKIVNYNPHPAIKAELNT